ncbi:MAG TPA: DNA polymerase II large subunit, partial [Candidatus Bathyarchaeota archaeon]|nr:DNA polymerase II large subunit [Candidatus Bathyarchaeota archaeon]
MLRVKMPPHYVDYFQELEDKLNQLYQVATEARAKGLDPATVVEVAITSDIAERIEKLIGPQGITERMRELESLDRREMSFKIAREIVLGRFGVMEREKAADQAVRTALAILTEGVTIAPIEGIPEIKIKSNPDGSQYLALY